MKKLIGILCDCCPDVDFENESGLIDNGLLDSLDIVTLVMELNEAYGIEIGIDEVLPENFNSVEAIYSLVNRLGGND